MGVADGGVAVLTRFGANDAILVERVHRDLLN
jgi:hypothetical protein